MLLALPLAIGTSGAQTAPPVPATPVPAPSAQPPADTAHASPPTPDASGPVPPAAGAPPAPSAVPSPSARATRPAPPNNVPTLESTGSGVYGPFGDVVARNGIVIHYNGLTIEADQADGNVNREIVFRGNARITDRGSITQADEIHFFPPLRRYRLDNPRAIVPPEDLQYRVGVPVYVRGGDLFGTRTGYSLADRILATTCIEPHPHYELHIKDATLFPHQRLVMHNVSTILFGVKLVTLPYVVIPLDEHRRPRTDYLPEFGENYYEGYFARFPYVFAERGDAATYVRADVTQKKGPGYRVEQEYLAGKQTSFFNTSGGGFSGGLGFNSDQGAYNTAYGYGSLGPRLARLGTGLGPQSGGLFTVQGYTNSGFDRDFTASFRHQQEIGGSNRFGFTTELQKQSALLGNASTTQATQFTFDHADATHGVAGTLNLNLNTNSSNGYDNNQFTGSLQQNYTFATRGTTRNNLGFNFNLSRTLTTSSITAFDGSGITTDTTTRNALLTSALKFDHSSREYTLSLDANKNTPFGFESGGVQNGQTENLPELQLVADTLNFKGGWFKRVPSNLVFGFGRYSEPATETNTERVIMALNVQPFSLVRGNTEVATQGGFEQRMYGDGAAQFTVRNNTRLRQHLAGRSGIDLNYQYEQPEGGTPFNFDPFQRSHNISADAGYLNDTHFQATLRTGYDLQGQSQGFPWQTLATHIMYRPNTFARLDQVTTYDPNTGKFGVIQQVLRFRARDPETFLDLVSSVDPKQPGIRRKFSQINTQFGFPLGRTWRVTGLIRFNGTTGLFESRNIQLVHRWDCLEASFTYTETPNSLVSDRQFYFALRVIGLPFYRSFNRGAAGEALSTGIGSIY